MIASYVRVSTDQQEQGLASQLAEVRRFIAQKSGGATATRMCVLDFDLGLQALAPQSNHGEP